MDGHELILAGICPYCGRGPFVSIAAHTARAHGVQNRQLRDEFGFTYSEVICDKSYHEVHQNVPEKCRQALRDWAEKPHSRSVQPRTLSKAGHASVGANRIRRNKESHRFKIREEQLPELLALREQGLSWLELAEYYGVSHQTVAWAARRAAEAERYSEPPERIGERLFAGRGAIPGE